MKIRSLARASMAADTSPGILLDSINPTGITRSASGQLVRGKASRLPFQGIGPRRTACGPVRRSPAPRRNARPKTLARHGIRPRMGLHP